MFTDITPLIITYNEAPNIRRVIEKLVWAQRIVVIDSGSTDETLQILKSYRQVDVIQRPFVNFADQCNFGLTQIHTPFALSLDADYELSDELVGELERLAFAESISGYRTRFVYRIHGRPLRGTLYPPRTILYRKDRASYVNEGHGHRVIIQGRVAALEGVIFHDDRKPLARWLTSQQRYAREEACYLLESSRDKLSRTDKIRLIGWPAPILVFFYTLFAKGCIADGWTGWHYVLQRLLAETLVAIEIVDRKLLKQQQAKSCAISELEKAETQ